MVLLVMGGGALWCQMCRSQYKSKLSLGADSNDNKTWRVVIKLSRVQSRLVWKLLISVPWYFYTSADTRNIHISSDGQWTSAEEEGWAVIILLALHFTTIMPHLDRGRHQEELEHHTGMNTLGQHLPILLAFSLSGYPSLPTQMSRPDQCCAGSVGSEGSDSLHIMWVISLHSACHYYDYNSNLTRTEWLYN